MTDPTPSRRDRLIAAALADDLSPAEAARFAALRAADPASTPSSPSWARSRHASPTSPSRTDGQEARAGSTSNPAPSCGDASRASRVQAMPTPVRSPSHLAPTPPTRPTAPSPRDPAARPLGRPPRSHHPPPEPAHPPHRARRRGLPRDRSRCGCPRRDARDGHVDSPPGTLGAVEPVAFAGAPSGSRSTATSSRTPGAPRRC